MIPRSRSAEHQGNRQAAFRRFLVLGVHLLGGQRHGADGRIEVHATIGRDLVAGDHEARPRLDRAERAAFDARDLHEARHRIARHPEVMLAATTRRRWPPPDGSKSCAWAMNAAPIADATPISAWHPPSAPDSVALCLHR